MVQFLQNCCFSAFDKRLWYNKYFDSMNYCIIQYIAKLGHVTAKDFVMLIWTLFLFLPKQYYQSWAQTPIGQWGRFYSNWFYHPPTQPPSLNFTQNNTTIDIIWHRLNRDVKGTLSSRTIFWYIKKVCSVISETFFVFQNSNCNPSKSAKNMKFLVKFYSKMVATAPLFAHFTRQRP